MSIKTTQDTTAILKSSYQIPDLPLSDVPLDL